MIQCLQKDDKEMWRRAFEIVWAEFWDMHALFETAKPPFGYMTSQSMRVLTDVRHIWEKYQDGPLATMDAGANVHLLYREDQMNLLQEMAAVLKKYAKVYGAEE